MLTNSIENAQARVESRNFGIRKSVLEYDDVMTKQRELIYEQRNKVLDGADISHLNIYQDAHFHPRVYTEEELSSLKIKQKKTD